MANEWYIAAGASDYDTIGDWSATEGGASSGNTPDNTSDVKYSDTSSSNNCTLDANGAAQSLAMDAVTSGGTDDWTQILNISTYDLAVTNKISAGNGTTIQIGVSGANGLTAGEILFVTGSILTMAATDTSIVKCAGNFTAPFSQIFSTNRLGHYHQTGSGNYDSPSTLNRCIHLPLMMALP